MLVLPICYFMSASGEIVDLTWMCGHRKEKIEQLQIFEGSLSPAAPTASGRRETLSRLADDYNEAFCANIGDGNSAASFFAAGTIDASDLREMRQYGITSRDLVRAASESRDC